MVFRAAPAPGLLRFRVHPLVSLASSPEFVAALTRPLLAAAGAFHGVRSLSIAASIRRVHLPAGSPPCLRSALGVSHTLDGLLLCAPRGLVSSRYHVRDLLFRGFPRQPAALARHQCVPSCRCRRPPATGLPRPLRFATARLQGLDPAADPLRHAGFLRLQTPDPLLSLLLLRVLLRSPRERLHAPSARDLPGRASSDPVRWPSAY
jgi:hypothetical protein